MDSCKDIHTKMMYVTVTQRCTCFHMTVVVITLNCYTDEVSTWVLATTKGGLNATLSTTSRLSRDGHNVRYVFLQIPK